jgi:hypothetical protein
MAFATVVPTGGDDRSSIQAAIAAVGTSGGGTVYLPSGTFHVDPDGTAGNTVALRLNYSNVTILGDGPSTVIDSRGTSGPDGNGERHHVIAIAVDHSGGQADPTIRNSGLRNLRLMTSSPETPHLSRPAPRNLYGYGIVNISGNSFGCFVDSCAIDTPDLCGITTGPANTTTRLRVTTTRLQLVGEHGIYMGGADNADCLIADCRFEGVNAAPDETRPTAIALKHTTRLAIRDNFLTGFRDAAINPADFSNTDLLIEANQFSDLRYEHGSSLEVGLNANWITGGIIRNNWFYNLRSTAMFLAPTVRVDKDTNGNVTGCAETDISGVTIEDNHIEKVCWPGMAVTVQYFDPTDPNNKVICPATFGLRLVSPKDVVVKGNTVRDTGGHGIQIDRVEGLCRVTGNTIWCTKPNPSRGIRVLPAQPATVVDNNVVHNMSTEWDGANLSDNLVDGHLSPPYVPYPQGLPPKFDPCS